MAPTRKNGTLDYHQEPEDQLDEATASMGFGPFHEEAHTGEQKCYLKQPDSSKAQAPPRVHRRQVGTMCDKVEEQGEGATPTMAADDQALGPGGQAVGDDCGDSEAY